MGKAKIINVYKVNYLHKNIKHKLKKQVVFSAACFCLIALSLCYFKVFMGDSVTGIFDMAAQVFNPITKLYSEENGGVFVNAENVYIASKDLAFTIPVRTSEIEVNNGEILFTVKDSIMVYSPEGGIVTEVGESNFGTKYIKILHNENIYSIIDNVDVIGCEVGDIVKKGREIATASYENVVKLSIFKDGLIVENLKVVKSNIEWS